MTVDSIVIKSYGMLRNVSLSFKEGINVIEGGNESGKSTIASFIKFMLYGFDNESDHTEVRRRVNHETGVIDGSMTITSPKGTWILERKVTPSKIPGEAPLYLLSCKVADTGEIIHLTKSPGETLLGMSREMYETAAFLSRAEEGASNSEAVLSNIESLIFSPGKQKETADAKVALEQERISIALDDTNPMSIPRLTQEVAALRNRLTSAMSGQRDVLGLNHHYEKEKKEADMAKIQLDRCKEVLRAYKAHLLLLEFEDLHKTEEIWDALMGEKEAFLQEYTANEYLPDAGYEMEFNIRRDDWKRAQETRDAKEAEVATLEATEPMTEETAKNMVRCEKHGGEVAVTADYMDRRSKFTVSLLIAILSGLLGGGLLALLIALLVGGVGSPLPLITGIGIGVAAVLCLVFSLVAKSKYKKMAGLALDYGAKSKKDFVSRIHAITKGREDARILKENLEEAQALLQKAKNKEKSTFREVKNLLIRWGVTLPMDNPRPDLSEFESRLTRCVARSLDIEERETSLQKTLETMHAKLDGEDEKKLRRLAPENRRPLLAETTEDIINASIEKYSVQYKEHHSKACTFQLQADAAEAGVEKPSELCEALCQQETALKEQKRRLSSIETLLGILKDAEETLKGEIAPKLAYYARELTDVMTGGKYPNMTVTQDLRLVAKEGDDLLRPEDLSAGTRNTAYLAFRLAIVRLLFREAPPLCFDDSFGEQDDTRLRAILQVISTLSQKGDIQTFLFTRQEREHALCSEFGPCNHIVLS